MTHAALIYGPGPTSLQTVGFVERVVGVRLLTGSEENIRNNLINYLAEGDDVFARDISNTVLADMGTTSDLRVPHTLEEFDEAYPGCEFSEEFLTPPAE